MGLKIEYGDRVWTVDLSCGYATRTPTSSSGALTSEQREAMLWITDVWHRRPEYPVEAGGLDLYTAVCADGVRGPAEFAGWPSERGHPGWL